MPAKLSLLERLPEDPGAEGLESENHPRAAAPKPQHVSKGDKRAAVDAVLALLGASTVAGAESTKPAVLPSARARTAIERLITYGNADELQQAQPDLKAMAKDLFDWDGAEAGTKATKVTVRAMVKVLTAVDETGVSLYPQAVEMLAFASASAPLLQPDRLARLIEKATEVTSAFAPDRYTVQLSSSLRVIFRKYSDQRREDLLGNLWHESHDGRWWDMTSGVVKLSTSGDRRNRRIARRGNDDDPEVQRLRANAEALREILAGANHGTAEADEAIKAALIDNTLAYSETAAELVRRLPRTADLEAKMTELSRSFASGEIVDPDQVVYASSLPWLPVSERPESPIGWLVKTLIRSLTPDLNVPVVAVDKLPDKPKSFAELFPKAALTEFPFLPEVFALHNTRLPGTDAQSPIVVEVVRDTVELLENREYMGNCTYSYKSRMEQGSYVLFKLWDGDECYNAATTFTERRYLQAGPGWVIDQINSRFNSGRVPARVQAGFESLVGAIPGHRLQRMATDDGEPLAPRRIGYSLR